MIINYCLFTVHLRGSYRRFGKRPTVETIGHSTHCDIRVNFDSRVTKPGNDPLPPMTISVNTKVGQHDPNRERDLRNARLQLQDLLLGFIGLDGSRGRLVYDVAKSCWGAHKTNKSVSRAVYAPDPWQAGEHRWITVLELPGKDRNKGKFSRLGALTPDVQNSLRKNTSCLVTVVREDFPTRFCDPYVFIAGTCFLLWIAP